MVGRLFTSEDEIDVLHDEIGKARRRLHSIEHAPGEGRWTRGGTEWLDAVANQRQRIRVLEAELREACAQQIAAAEAFSCGLTTGLEEFLGGRP